MFNLLGAGTRDPTVSEIDRLRPHAITNEAFVAAAKRASREFWAEQVRQQRTHQTNFPLGMDDT